MRVTSTEGTFYTSVQCTYTTPTSAPGTGTRVSLGTRNDDAWGMYVSCKL